VRGPRGSCVTLALVASTAAWLPAPTARAVPDGWAGEVLLDPTGNDWEPAIAADPAGPRLYALVTRFGAPCADRCPDPALFLLASADGGETWGSAHRLCPCPGAAQQWDPQIEVAGDGTVYAAWLQEEGPWRVLFARSRDHGATWSEPIAVSGPGWADKPAMAVSDDGRDVYVAWSRAALFVAASHDGGSTWGRRLQIGVSSRFHAPWGMAVAPDGTAYVGATSDAPSFRGPVHAMVFRSADGGASWSGRVIDTVFTGADPFTTHPRVTVAVDAGGRASVVYSGSTQAGGRGRVWSSSSVDGGGTWAPGVELPTGATELGAGFPAAVGAEEGELRAWFMDDRTGRWNTWYVRSTDGGATWSTPVRLSASGGGAAYRDPLGFVSPYGDYGEIDVDASGRTVAVWGEGIGPPPGPGGSWFAREA
jgi:uncharacterized protein (DUF736 family)